MVVGGIRERFHITPSVVNPLMRPAHGSDLSNTTVEGDTFKIQIDGELVGAQHGKALAQAMEDRFAGRSRLIKVNDAANAIGSQWHHVSNDFEQLTELAVEHLVSQGHSRIGYLTHPRKLQTSQGDEQPKRTTGHTHYILSLGQSLRRRAMRHALTVHYRPRETSPEFDDARATPFRAPLKIT